MPFSCAEATTQYVATLSEGFNCSEMGSTLRVTTPYPYPDNDFIEVFIEDTPSGLIRVSDLGQTLRLLHSLGLDVDASRKRMGIAETLAAGSNVMLARGQLMREGPASEVGSMMFDVIVAARAVSDLVLTSRAYEAATFREEVGGLLEQNDIEFVTGAKLTGQTGKVYRVDFFLPETGSFIETLSPAQSGGMQNVLNRVFRVWTDVNGHLSTRSKVSLVNDVDFRWQGADVALLDRVSRVAYWSDQEAFIAALAPPSARRQPA